MTVSFGAGAGATTSTTVIRRAKKVTIQEPTNSTVDVYGPKPKASTERAIRRARAIGIAARAFKPMLIPRSRRDSKLTGISIPSSISSLLDLPKTYVKIMGPHLRGIRREELLREQYRQLKPEEVATHPVAIEWREADSDLNKTLKPHNPMSEISSEALVLRHPPTRTAIYDNHGLSVPAPKHPFAKLGQSYELDPTSNTYKDLGRSVKLSKMRSYWHDRSNTSLSHPVQTTPLTEKVSQALEDDKRFSSDSTPGVKRIRSSHDFLKEDLKLHEKGLLSSEELEASLQKHQALQHTSTLVTLNSTPRTQKLLTYPGWGFESPAYHMQSGEKGFVTANPIQPASPLSKQEKIQQATDAKKPQETWPNTVYNYFANLLKRSP